MFLTAVLMTLTPVELVQDHTSPSAQLFVGPSLLASVILLAFALLFSFKLETSRLKYLISDGMNWRELVGSNNIGSQKIKVHDFGDPLSFIQEVDIFCFCVKCLENYWMDCHNIWSRYLRSPDDVSK